MPDFVKLNDAYYCVDILCVPDESDRLKCMLFDMSSLWLQTLPIASVVERENKRNPVCNYTEALVRSTLLADQAASYTLDPTVHEDNHRTLTVKHYISSIPVTFEFTLLPATADELKECAIVPLWQAVLLLDFKNRALAEQLTRKDVEIEQYRAEGAELKRSKGLAIGRKHQRTATVQTAKFDHQAFDKNFPLRIPTNNGMDVLRILDGREQRENLKNALEMVVLSSEHTGDGSAISRKPTKRSPSSRWGLKKSPKKWKHQRVDVLCTKIKFPILPNNPLNSSLTLAERIRREQDQQ